MKNWVAEKQAFKSSLGAGLVLAITPDEEWILSLIFDTDARCAVLHIHPYGDKIGAGPTFRVAELDFDGKEARGVVRVYLESEEDVQWTLNTLPLLLYMAYDNHALLGDFYASALQEFSDAMERRQDGSHYAIVRTVDGKDEETLFQALSEQSALRTIRDDMAYELDEEGDILKQVQSEGLNVVLRFEEDKYLPVEGRCWLDEEECDPEE